MDELIKLSKEITSIFKRIQEEQDFITDRKTCIIQETQKGIKGFLHTSKYEYENDIRKANEIICRFWEKYHIKKSELDGILAKESIKLV